MTLVFSKIFKPLRVFRTPRFPAFLAAALAAFFAAPAPLMAQTLGDIFCNVAANVGPFVNLFNWFAYAAGAYLIVQGVLHLKGYYENPNQHQLHKLIARFVGGAMLMLLPNVIGTLVQTIFFAQGFGGGFIACLPGFTSGSINVPLDVMLANFVSNIRDPFIALVSIISITMGVFFVVRGLVKASHYGTDPRAHSVTSILTNLIVGAILVSGGQILDMITASVFGFGGVLTFNSLSWTAIDQLGNTQHFKTAVEAALRFFQLIGLISFVRGFYIIKNAIEGQGQATIPQGLTHVVGGVLAINIFMFMRVMDYTFGTQFVT